MPSANTSDSAPVDLKVQLEYAVGSYEQDYTHAYYKLPWERAMDIMCETAEDTIRAAVATRTDDGARAVRDTKQLVASVVINIQNALGVHGWRVRSAAIGEVARPDASPTAQAMERGVVVLGTRLAEQEPRPCLVAPLECFKSDNLFVAVQ